MRFLLAVLLLAAAAFCGFGFLATFEPVGGALGWRVGYAVAILACVLGSSRLLRRGGGDGQ